MTDLSQSDLANSFSPVGFEWLWDKMVVSAVQTPGRVTLTGHGREVKWDIKDGDGQDGASTTRKGLRPAAFSSTFQLAVDFDAGVDEFAEWDRFVPILKASFSAETPNALDIYHPDLAQLDIVSAVVKKIYGTKHDGKGGGTVKVDWLEYRPPRPKKAKSPKTSKAGADGWIEQKIMPPDPNADLQDEIADLLDQVKTL